MLVEDNIEYRRVIELAIQHEPMLELTCQFGTSEIALRRLSETAEEEQPDLVLMDLRLPGMDGLEALPQFKVAAPNTKIIVLTQSNHEHDVLQAISLGASGYLLKSATLDVIIESIHSVVDGGAPLDKGVAKFLLDKLQTKLPQSETQQLLTARELEVIMLLAEGLVKKEIAKELNIGYSTVDTHVARIYQKLNVTNAPSAVDRAHRLGIFPAEND
jgi:DNA-binding NarL/FixJ family response regulator